MNLKTFFSEVDFLREEELKGCLLLSAQTPFNYPKNLPLWYSLMMENPFKYQ